VPAKKLGVHYASTADGVELPVIDITHPAFAVSLDSTDQARLIGEFMREQRALAKLPKLVSSLIYRIFLHGSVHADSLRHSHGTFLAGLSTYLFKLGPDNIGHASSKVIDRKIAATLPSLAMRVRLQDNAQLLANALFPALQTSLQRPLQLLNIAGGPAFDSINALILLRRRSPALFAERQVGICVLDSDQAGPTFGERALRALQASSGPLHGMEIEFERRDYDWRSPAGLHAPLTAANAAGALCAISSEGGLFEYGSDAEILGNLRTLNEAGTVACVAGSVTRADEPLQVLRAAALAMAANAALQPRGLKVFSELAARAGYTVARAVERPFCDNVLLLPA
jgi:hypothetical protein